MFCTGGSVPHSARTEAFFPAVFFVDTNLPQETVQELLSEKELRKLPGNSPNILKKSNIDCYMERPSATFCNGKYSILDDLECCTLENKSRKTGKYGQMSWIII